MISGQTQVQDAPVACKLEKHGLPSPESACLFSGSLASVVINFGYLERGVCLSASKRSARLWSTARSLFEMANCLIYQATCSADRLTVWQVDIVSASYLGIHGCQGPTRFIGAEYRSLTRGVCMLIWQWTVAHSMRNSRRKLSGRRSNTGAYGESDHFIMSQDRCCVLQVSSARSVSRPPWSFPSARVRLYGNAMVIWPLNRLQGRRAARAYDVQREPSAFG